MCKPGTIATLIASAGKSSSLNERERDVALTIENAVAWFPTLRADTGDPSRG
jgi:hypothetical protein